MILLNISFNVQIHFAFPVFLANCFSQRYAQIIGYHEYDDFEIYCTLRNVLTVLIFY